MQNEDILSRTIPGARHRLSYGPDPNHFADVRLPAAPAPHPVVFFIHGGFWRAQYDLAHAGHLCHALAAAGIATWNVEYRRSGNPGGGWPGTLDDLRRALDLLIAGKHTLRTDFDTSRVCVAGHSAGGHLALRLAAADGRIRHVVSLGGVVDIQRAWELHLSNDAVAEFLGGTPAQLPDRYRDADPMELPVCARQILIHGLNDESVPHDFSAAYFRRKLVRREDVKLISPPAGHFELIDPQSQVWPEVLRVFQNSTAGQ